MKINLDMIELSIQSFLENIQIYPPENQKESLAHQLVEAMRDALVIHPDGTVKAPSIFNISMNPAMVSLWQTQRADLDALANLLRDTAGTSGIIFDSPPVLRLEQDEELNEGEFHISCPRFPRSVENTAVLMDLSGQSPHVNPDSQPQNACLITSNGLVHPLEKAVVNIGRQLENHLVIDDPRISRKHAQLRIIHGRYVLFDLNSTGGTFLNSKRITQATLQSGDVISLAGITLIYNEDNLPDGENTDEYQNL